jgi:hypothetical protein
MQALEEEIDGPLRVLLNDLAASQLDIARAQPCVSRRIPSPPPPPPPPEPEPVLPSQLNLVDWATSVSLNVTRAAVVALLPDLPLRASMIVRHLAPNGTITLRVRCVRYPSAKYFHLVTSSSSRVSGFSGVGFDQYGSRHLQSRLRISSAAIESVCLLCVAGSLLPRLCIPVPTAPCRHPHRGCRRCHPWGMHLPMRGCRGR